HTATAPIGSRAANTAGPEDSTTFGSRRPTTNVPSSPRARTAAQRERSLELKVGQGSGRVAGQAGRGGGGSPEGRWPLGAYSRSAERSRPAARPTAAAISTAWSVRLLSAGWSGSGVMRGRGYRGGDGPRDYQMGGADERIRDGVRRGGAGRSG